MKFIFLKSADKIQVSFKSSDTLHEGQYTFSIISRLILLSMRNVSDKYCTAGQATDDNMAHARCMLVT